MDLLEPPAAAAVEARLRSINSTAHIIRTTRSKVDLALLLNRGAYRLRLLDNSTQQQPQQQQAAASATAAQALPTTAPQQLAAAGSTQQQQQQQVLPGALQQPLAWLGDRIAQAAAAGAAGDGAPADLGHHSCCDDGCTHPEHQHGATEGGSSSSSGACLAHDAAVRTLALRSGRPVELGSFRTWVEQLLWEQQPAGETSAPAAGAGGAVSQAGAAVPAVPQLLRMKGLLNVDGSDRVHLFQAVYDLYDIAPGATWQQFQQQQQQQQGCEGAAADRLSRLVLIGRGLDQQALQSAFEQCCSVG
jgi:G3E family GTPase